MSEIVFNDGIHLLAIKQTHIIHEYNHILSDRFRHVFRMTLNLITHHCFLIL